MSRSPYPGWSPDVLDFLSQVDGSADAPLWARVVGWPVLLLVIVFARGGSRG